MFPPLLPFIWQQSLKQEPPCQEFAPIWERQVFDPSPTDVFKLYSEGWYVVEVGGIATSSAEAETRGEGFRRALLDYDVNVPTLLTPMISSWPTKYQRFVTFDKPVPKEMGLHMILK